MNQTEAAKPLAQTERLHSFRSSEFSWFFIPVAIACVFCGFVFEYGGHRVLAVLCYLGATVGLGGHSGFQIDTEHQLQRFYLSYMGLKVGGWQPLRNYDRICVRLCRGSARNLATWRDIKNDHYKIFLFTGVQSEAVCIFHTADSDVANETAARLKRALPNAEIVHN